MRIKELDGLRGIAVLAVIDCHYLAWLPAAGSQYGWLGVDLFFVLSGFLITSILLQLRNKERYFKTFYARRALRILPPYLLGLFVYIAASFALHEPGPLKMWLSYIFYYVSFFRFQPAMLQGSQKLPVIVCFGLAVLWSLSVEEVYYTIWAPVVRFTRDKGLVGILAAMVIIAPVLRWILHSSDGVELFTFYCRMDGLAYGSAVALLIRYRQMRPDAWTLVDRVFDRFALAVPVFTATFWLLLGRHAISPLVSSLGISLSDLSFALITHALIRRSGGNQPWIRIFRAKWLRSIGMVSYSLYLFHYPLLIASEEMLKPLHLSRHVQVVSQMSLGLVLTFAVAYGLWYGMESRILRWKDKTVPSPAHPQMSDSATMVTR
jgi:peptidoglycan/LPS O-acetylase OafA/YrhL